MPEPQVQSPWRGPLSSPAAPPTELHETNELKNFRYMLHLLYNTALLFLPYFYRSRLYQVLRGVSLTEDEIRSLYVNAAPRESVKLRYWDDVKRSWSEFLDSVLNEWRTLIIVSALLLTCVTFLPARTCV